MKSKLDVVQRLRQITREIIVPVSGGKDSVATLILLERYGFKMWPYTMYVVDGLSFQETYRAYLERRFGFTITRYPHPDLGEMYRIGRYCTPQPDFPKLTFQDIEAAARVDSGLEWIAGGEKMVDSLQRRGMIHVSGGISEQRRRAWPLMEWNDNDVYALLKKARVHLPADYAMYKQSYGGTPEPDSLYHIKQRFPEDYARIKAVFPLVDVAVDRYHLQQERAKDER